MSHRQGATGRSGPIRLDQLPVVSDKRNGVCGYCLRGLTAQLLADGRTHYCCPFACKPWMTVPGPSHR